MAQGVLALALVHAAVGAEGPCDILAAAGNPCVAAHSTTRALFEHYDGALYNVTRPDGSATSIGVVGPGGFADIKLHEQFCAKGDCVISHVTDQSNCGGKCPPGQGNNLGPRHKLVNASQHKITVGAARTPVFGMWFDPGYGYHVDNTTGIATGNDPESIYAVMVSQGPRLIPRHVASHGKLLWLLYQSGTHYNGGCCFDVSHGKLLWQPTPGGDAWLRCAVWQQRNE